jgi:hypothetical protein
MIVEIPMKWRSAYFLRWKLLRGATYPQSESAAGKFVHTICCKERWFGRKGADLRNTNVPMERVQRKLGTTNCGQLRVLQEMLYASRPLRP